MSKNSRGAWVNVTKAESPAVGNTITASFNIDENTKLNTKLLEQYSLEVINNALKEHDLEINDIENAKGQVEKIIGNKKPSEVTLNDLDGKSITATVNGTKYIFNLVVAAKDSEE